MHGDHHGVLRRRNLPCLTVWVLLSVAMTLGETETSTEVLHHLLPLDTEAGVVTARDALEVEVEVPIDCEKGPLACRQSRHFPRVISLHFDLEQTLVENGEVSRNRESRGTIHLALKVKEEDERRIWKQLRDRLSALGAASFSRTFAGLDQWLRSSYLADLCIEPCFACFEQTERVAVIKYSRELGKGPDGEDRVASSTVAGLPSDERTLPLCDDLAEATASAHPEAFRTVTMPLAVESVRVILETADNLPAEIYTAQLVPLPAAASAETYPAADGVTSYSRSTWFEETGEYESERAANGQVTMVRTAPGALSRHALRNLSWIGRWTVLRATEQLGEFPTSSTDSPASLTTVLLPTSPPRRLDKDRRPLPAEDDDQIVGLRFDADAFVSKIVQRLDERSQVAVDIIEEIAASRPAGLGPPAWILVICREDGTATYWLPPTAAPSPLTNADIFCSEADRQID